jgi:Ca-activated chloride channel family protein
MTAWTLSPAAGRSVATALPHLVALAAGGAVVFWAAARFELAQPWAVAAGAAIALLAATVRVVRAARGRSEHLVQSLTPLQLSGKRVRWAGIPIEAALPELPFAARTLALVYLGTAASGPQSASSIEDLEREGIDIVLALDVSASMLSKDFSPNRLEEAKEVAQEFVEGRPHDRIGVVAYEGEAFTQVPLTTDIRVVLESIDELSTGKLAPGTAVGMGLATAVNRLRTSDSPSKVIVLLTDGENNTGSIEPRDAAQLAEIEGIRVYTIGVGTIGKAKSPVQKVGNEYIYDWVDVKIDEPSLKAIAASTGGAYFRATSGEKLREIYREIDAMEKARFQVLRYNQRTEEFRFFGVLALASLIGELLLRSFLFRSLT